MALYSGSRSRLGDPTGPEIKRWTGPCKAARQDEEDERARARVRHSRRASTPHAIAPYKPMMVPVPSRVAWGPQNYDRGRDIGDTWGWRREKQRVGRSNYRDGTRDIFFLLWVCTLRRRKLRMLVERHLWAAALWHRWPGRLHMVTPAEGGRAAAKRKSERESHRLLQPMGSRPRNGARLREPSGWWWGVNGKASAASEGLPQLRQRTSHREARRTTAPAGAAGALRGAARRESHSATFNQSSPARVPIR